MTIKTSSSVTLSIGIQTMDGRPALGLALSALSYEIRLAGVVQSITPTLTESATVGDFRVYNLAFTAPATAGRLWMNVRPVNRQRHVLSWDSFDEDLSVYTLDSLGSIIATTGTIVVSDLSTETSLEIYDGDSIDVNLTVPEAALTALGAASLAAIDALACGVKLNSLNSDDPQSATLSTSIVTDTSGNRVVRAYLNAFPAALAVSDATQSTQATIALRATEGTKTFIVATCALTIKWKATTA
jgi:hypothetical protein